MIGRPRTFHGIIASPGIAIGRIFLMDRLRMRVPRYHIQPDQVDYEIERLHNAIDKSVEQLETIRKRFVGKGMDHQSILEAHAMMVQDRSLLEEAAGLISGELINAEWAVTRVVGRIRSLFDRVSDSYFRERRGDIDFVGDRIVRNLAGQAADLGNIGSIEEGTVIVAHDLSPADTATLSRHRVTAFVTEAGGKTSHTSIIARSMEVPAVVGVQGILEAAGGGDLVIVDGLEGGVFLRPTRAQIDRSRQRGDRYAQLSLSILEARALPARTVDGRDVKIYGNIEMPTEVSNVLNRGGEGIGLYRTEFMFLGRNEVPNEEDHYRAYCRLFDEMADRPVTVRTLDLGGDKLFGGMTQEVEPNPAMGLRAIRYCLRHPEVFEAQVAGLLRAAVHGKLHIMLPMISSIDELRLARGFIHSVYERLVRDGKECRRDVPVGIMIEVPSAVITADHLARECDFFAIGTNDLMQFLLAIDRTNERVDYLYLPLQPAVLRTLHMVTQAAHGAGIPVSMCGEMAGSPQYVPILLGLRIDELSMNAGSIPHVKRLVRELRQDECEELLQQSLRCATHEEVAVLLQNFLRGKNTGLAALEQSGE